MFTRLLVILFTSLFAACGKTERVVPVYTWKDEIDPVIREWGGALALLQYQGDRLGRPVDRGVEEVALWLQRNGISCYYYRPEPVEGQILLDALMIPVSSAGSQIRERLQTAVDQDDFTDGALRVLRKQLSINPSSEKEKG